MNQSPALQRSLGVFAITITGVGTILGAGIYVLIGETAASAGSAVWASFLLAAAIAAATGMSYAELASCIPSAGASSAYARIAFGPRAGFIAGWLQLLVGVIGAGAVAIGFGGYLHDLIGGPQRLLTVLVILMSGVILARGVRETIAVAVALTLIEAVGLIVVILVGLPDLGQRSLLDSSDGLLGVLSGTALVFFAFQGFEEIATLSEEAHEPRDTVPRAIILAIGITSALYLLVAVVSVSVVPWEELAASSAPLALVVEVAISERLGDALSLIALFSTANTVLMLLAASARISYGMSELGLLPAVLRRVSRRGTPWVASLLVTGGAALLGLAGNIGFVAQMTNVAVFSTFFIVNAAVLQLRRSRPHASRGYRSRPEWRGVPLLPIAGLIGTAGLALALDREALVAGLLALAVGVVLAVFLAPRPGEDSPDLPAIIEERR